MNDQFLSLMLWKNKKMLKCLITIHYLSKLPKHEDYSFVLCDEINKFGILQKRQDILTSILYKKYENLTYHYCQNE